MAEKRQHQQSCIMPGMVADIDELENSTAKNVDDQGDVDGRDAPGHDVKIE